MERNMTILYKVHNNLYVNLTNRCSASCVFCLRQTKQAMGEADTLWLQHEPTFEELKAEFSKFNVDEYEEVVFCGYGEPTEAFDVLLQVASYVKQQFNKPVRINTNGHGNLINGRSIAKEMKGLVDTVSISLNTPNAEKYHQLVRSRFGFQAYEAMLQFAKEAKEYIPNVVFTTVDTTLTKEEEEQCRKICEDLGVLYRIRPWEE